MCRVKLTDPALTRLIPERTGNDFN
jgi:hypothetical protein